MPLRIIVQRSTIPTNNHPRILNMKRLTVIAALALGGLVTCSSMANAQEGRDGRGERGKRGGRPSVHQRVDQMIASLRLTEDQKPRFNAVREDTSKKLQALFAGGPSKEQMRAKMQPIREEEARKMKEILTAEQFAKWQKWMEEESRFSVGGKHKID